MKRVLETLALIVSILNFAACGRTHITPLTLEATPAIESAASTSILTGGLTPTAAGTVIPTERPITTQVIKTGTAQLSTATSVSDSEPTAPPTFIPVLPEISNEKCLASEPREDATLAGVWFRYKPDQPTEIERYYFGQDGTVFVWLGGHTSDGLAIEPRILKGDYIRLQTQKIEIRVLHWPHSSLQYGICGDRLVMKDAAGEAAEEMAFIRVAEWCWDNPASYPDQCYPR